MDIFKVNYDKAVRFESPEFVPARVTINPSCWESYPREFLLEMVYSHPSIFPNPQARINAKLTPWSTKGISHKDGWGCIWQTCQNGITGVPVHHPLADWKDFEHYTGPDYEKSDGWADIHWESIAKNIEDQKSRQGSAGAGLVHGHTFLRLTYLRGYENLLFDMFDDNPMLYKLIDMVVQFNLGLVNKYIKLGVDEFSYPDDLGMQVGPMITVEMFKKHIKPAYRTLMLPARQNGCIIHMHSDGDIRDLTEDLLECGVNVLNLQDTVNGIDWIRDNLKGRVCIDLDIDRQNVTFLGTPSQIHAHVRYAVETLSDPKGGLTLKYGLYPGLPHENVKAVFDAMTECSQVYS